MIARAGERAWNRSQIRAAHNDLVDLLSGKLDLKIPANLKFAARHWLDALCLELGCTSSDCEAVRDRLRLSQLLAEIARVRSIDAGIREGAVTNASGADTADELLAHPEKFQTCRECGCTEMDACHDPAIGPCSWVEPGLCSHCVPVGDYLAVLRYMAIEEAEEETAPLGDNFPVLTP